MGKLCESTSPGVFRVDPTPRMEHEFTKMRLARASSFPWLCPGLAEQVCENQSRAAMPQLLGPFRSCRIRPCRLGCFFVKPKGWTLTMKVLFIGILDSMFISLSIESHARHVQTMLVISKHKVPSFLNARMSHADCTRHGETKC